MPRTGRRWRTSAVALAALVLSAAPLSARKTSPVGSFVLPGVDVSEAELEAGAWCRYLVVDEAMGVVDSTSLYVAALSRQDGPDGPAWWIEVDSRTLGEPHADRETTRLLVSADITSRARGDSLYRYIRVAYIREGDGPVQRADPADLRRLTLTRPTSASDWSRTPNVSVDTPAGSFVCDEKELTVVDARKIPTGRVTIVKRDVDRYRVWSSKTVPLFGLVRCVIERSHETRTEPALPGIPAPGPKKSRTSVVVTGTGHDAKPLITLP